VVGAGLSTLASAFAVFCRLVGCFVFGDDDDDEVVEEERVDDGGEVEGGFGVCFNIDFGVLTGVATFGAGGW